MKVQLLKVTAFALLQSFFAHAMEDVAVAKAGIENIAVDAAYVAVSKDDLNRCLDDCDDAGFTGQKWTACRARCEADYGRRPQPNRRPTRRPTKRPTNRRPTRRPTKRPSRPNGPNPRPDGSPTRRPTRRPNNREPTRPTRRPTRRPTGTRPTRRPTRRPTERMPTSDCEGLGEAAAEFIVFDNVCIPDFQSTSSRSSYDSSCRRVAYGVCQGEVPKKARQYCPDDNLSTRRTANLQDKCYDEVDNLTGGISEGVEDSA